MNAQAFTPGVFNAVTKVIERFFKRRCDTKRALLKIGFSEAEADVRSRYVDPEESLANALILIRRRDSSRRLTVESAMEIAQTAIGDPAPVELQYHRWAESHGIALKPYQSLAAKLAVAR